MNDLKIIILGITGFVSSLISLCASSAFDSNQQQVEENHCILPYEPQYINATVSFETVCLSLNQLRPSSNGIILNALGLGSNSSIRKMQVFVLDRLIKQVIRYCKENANIRASVNVYIGKLITAINNGALNNPVSMANYKSLSFEIMKLGAFANGCYQ